MDFNALFWKGVMDSCNILSRSAFVFYYMIRNRRIHAIEKHTFFGFMQ
jgi:hypothetical protein